MSTLSAENHDSKGISQRKAKHLEICVKKELYSVEGGKTGLEEIRFPHFSLPEISLGDVDLTTIFLGRSVALPLFISCMTGGSSEGFLANKELARAAQETGIGVGMGSHRILFRDESVFEHFHLRPLAPDVPIFSNMGGIQIREIPHEKLIEMNKRLEVDAQVIHLNPAQEIFQPDGDQDFRGIKDAIRRFIEASPIPVIVKETGCGIAPKEAVELLAMGAGYVDVAGSGGTNWILVEAARGGTRELSDGQEFQDWGWPTALLLDSLKGLPQTRGKVLASGGLRNGTDLAKALALGAALGGMALPFIRRVTEGGSEAVLELIDEIRISLARIMVLTSCKKPEQLAALPLYFPSGWDNVKSWALRT